MSLRQEQILKLITLSPFISLSFLKYILPSAAWYLIFFKNGIDSYIPVCAVDITMMLVNDIFKRHHVIYCYINFHHFKFYFQTFVVYSHTLVSIINESTIIIKPLCLCQMLLQFVTHIHIGRSKQHTNQLAFHQSLFLPLCWTMGIKPDVSRECGGDVKDFVSDQSLVQHSQPVVLHTIKITDFCHNVEIFYIFVFYFYLDWTLWK